MSLNESRCPPPLLFQTARTNQLPLFCYSAWRSPPLSVITIPTGRCTPLWLGAPLYDGVSLSHVSMNLFTG